MSTTSTYTVTMPDLKTDTQHAGLWSNYGSSVQMPGRSNNFDSTASNPSSTSPHLGRPRSSIPSMDYPGYHYGRNSQDESDAYDRQHHPSIQPHHSFSNLKRPYSQSEQPPFTEIVQDLRDDGTKLGFSQDHKLLCFRQVENKHTIVDPHGRIQQLELSAQLHGMFFLSEMPTSTNDGVILQPELTCYRRNLFQISGSLVTPRTPLSVNTETGETVPVASTDVTISAVESVDGHPVRLIVIPWKTPPPNSPEISQAPDQEPPPLPLIPFQNDSPENEGQYAMYPIGWRRLQFRIATANNGRRKELQQHFVLHLKVVGTLTDGSKAVLAEGITAPIVVRGRSPRNFQARKEIPLLGSSAGSRGQALVETGLGIVAGPLTEKPQDSKARSPNIDPPRSSFTFSAPKMPGSPISIRSNQYPASWNQSSQVPLTHIPASGSNYPAATLAAEPYQKLSLSGTQNFTAEPQELPSQTSIPSVHLPLSNQDQQQSPIRAPYVTYVEGTSGTAQMALSATAEGPLNVPRYVDDGPRPSKNHRQPSAHGAGSLANDSPTTEYRYGPTYVGINSTPAGIGQQNQQASAYGGMGQDSGSTTPSAAPPARDYFPPPHSWAATTGESTTPSASYSSGDNRAYAFPDQYKSGHGAVKVEPHQPQTPHSTPNLYQGSAINQYSWNAT